MAFASEAKNLVGLCPRIMPFPPGHYWDGEFHRYADLTTVTEYCHDDEETACRHIRELLIQAASCSPAASTPRSCAPLPPGCCKSPSAPLQ